MQAIFENKDEVFNNLDKITKNINKRLLSFAEITGRNIVQRSKELVPVINGDLRESINYKVNRFGKEVSVDIFSKLPYAAKVHYETGSRKYFITDAIKEEQPRIKLGIDEILRTCKNG